MFVRNASRDPARAKLLATVLLLIFYLFTIRWIVEAKAADWKICASDHIFVTYYDSASISYPSEGVVRVQTKNAYLDANKYKDFHNKRKLPPEYHRLYEKWAYTLSLIDLRCKSREFRAISTISVDVDGKTIDSYSTKEPSKAAWNYIEPSKDPNDPFENLLKIFCP